MAIAQVRGWVLDQQAPTERLLRLLDMAAEEAETLLGIGEWQQVVQVSAANRAPRQMLGDEHRLDAVDQRLEPNEMTAVELLGAAQGQGDPVKAHFIVTPQLEKPVHRHCLRHVILGMHFEEAEFWPRRRDLSRVLRTEADSRTRDRPIFGHNRDSARRLRQVLLRLPPSILVQVPAGT